MTTGAAMPLPLAAPGAGRGTVGGVRDRMASTRIRNLEKELENAAKQYEAKEREVEKLNADLTAKDVSIAEKDGLVSTLRQQFTENVARADGLQIQLESSTTQLNALGTDKEALLQQLQQKDAEIARLKTIETNHGTLTSELANVRERLRVSEEALNTQKAQHEQASSKHSADFNAKVNELENTKGELQQSLVKVAQLADRLSKVPSTTGGADGADGESALVASAQSDTAVAMQRLQEETAAANTRAQEAEERLREKETELDTFKKERDQFEEKLNELEPFHKVLDSTCSYLGECDKKMTQMARISDYVTLQTRCTEDIFSDMQTSLNDARVKELRHNVEVFQLKHNASLITKTEKKFPPIILCENYPSIRIENGDLSPLSSYLIFQNTLGLETHDHFLRFSEALQKIDPFFEDFKRCSTGVKLNCAVDGASLDVLHEQAHDALTRFRVLLPTELSREIDDAPGALVDLYLLCNTSTDIILRADGRIIVNLVTMTWHQSCGSRPDHNSFLYKCIECWKCVRPFFLISASNDISCWKFREALERFKEIPQIHDVLNEITPPLSDPDDD